MGIIESAREWLGTPWQHNQRCKGVGVDCVQFIAALAEEQGIKIGPIENYYREPQKDELFWHLRCIAGLEEVSFTEPGDILLFRVGGIPRHLGVATERGMVHADAKVGRVVEISNLGFWERLIVARFRIDSGFVGGEPYSDYEPMGGD